MKLVGTSLAYDRERKLPLYAGAGIPEAWVVDLNAGAIEAYSGPGPDDYGRVVWATLLGLAFDAAETLPSEG